MQPARLSDIRATAPARQDTALLAKVRERLSFAVNVLCTLPRTAFDAQSRNALIRAASDIYDAARDLDRLIDMSDAALLAKVRACITGTADELCTLPRTAFDAQGWIALIGAASGIYDAARDLDRYIDMYEAATLRRFRLRLIASLNSDGAPARPHPENDHDRDSPDPCHDRAGRGFHDHNAITPETAPDRPASLP